MNVIMFLYQEQPNSSLLAIRVDLGDYQMTYHHMEQNGREMVSFNQNILPTQEVSQFIHQWVERQFHQHHVMNLFRVSFQSCMNQNELQIVRVTP